MVLAHVRPAHVLGQSGGGGLLAGEVRGRLLAVTHRERGVFVKCARLLHHLDQLANRHLPEHVASAVRLLHVLGQQAGVGLADLRERFAGDEVDDLVKLEALVRLAPAENGNLDHINVFGMFPGGRPLRLQCHW